jgi:hypothetical protein
MFYASSQSNSHNFIPNKSYIFFYGAISVCCILMILIKELFFVDIIKLLLKK